ncbi:MAG: sialate O-acetylesterase [Verrucomicrobia bacterium]|nr:sialate O-acetylesterase [Verrucomicrobiota bacterium]
MPRSLPSLPVLACLFALALHSALADVRLPAIFSDHMVLQQNAAIKIWGWADPLETVVVSLGGQVLGTAADKDGRWEVKLAKKFKAGDKLALVVKGKNTLTVNDVLVGEVWLCSGQSNMAMTVDRSKDFDNEKAHANFPKIRMFTVERNPQPTPQAECRGKWEICSAATVGHFSAAGYFFGRDLHQQLRVPVGLINSSYGGTAVEAWTSMDAQAKLPEYKTISEPWNKLTAQPWNEKTALANYEKQVAAWKENVKKAKAASKAVPRGPQKPVDPRFNQNHPATLYNGMIAPIVGYAIRGAIWYQGESNAGKPFANLYGLQLATMIKDWRTRWGSEFAFAWVQLPDFKAPQKEPVENTGWTTVREEMLKTLKVPHTGMAITLGLGEEKDIHPKNKQEVGHRLALWALDDVYEREQFPGSGPLPAGHRTRGSEIIISFKETSGGLRATDKALKGFAIAGADKKFVWANARIEGDKVIVSHPAVPKPAAVRYAWADNPVWSLINGAGLPATPFRTDDWK